MRRTRSPVVSAILLILFVATCFGAAEKAHAGFQPLGGQNYAVYTSTAFPYSTFQGPYPYCTVWLGSTCFSAEGSPICFCGNFNSGGESLCNHPMYPHTAADEVNASGHHQCVLTRTSDGNKWRLDYKIQQTTATYCPANSTLEGSLCECKDGFVESGSSCVPREKNLGCTKSTRSFIHVGNPCNAGTGTKFQAELVYRSGGTPQLQESLSYNSRLLSDISLVWNGAYGKGWKGPSWVRPKAPHITLSREICV